MKLTLEVDHPLAKAIRNATWDLGAAGNLILSVDVLDRSGTHSRPMSMRLTSWSILGKSGRHAKEPDHRFECEFVDENEHQRLLAQLTDGGRQ